ncbi:MAG TPA: metalloregulator ArsR/SmtB family transcription factor [Actinomycetota bacterium]|jgi:DNA-binding transcriptional ArsR family regulator
MGERLREGDILDGTYAALGHDVRRSVLSVLREGPARVTDLARPFELSLNTVSKHLRVLESARLVERDVHGRDHWMSLRAQPLETASLWLEGYRTFWEGRLDALDRLMRGGR